MIATSTTDGEDFVAPDSHVPATSEARETKQGLPEDREGMLQLVRGAFPDLKAEDAFEVPTWFPQQKKWVEDPAGSETVVYNFPLGLRIRGALEPGALRKGLQEIVRRAGIIHDAQAAANPDHGRQAGLQMKIAGAFALRQGD